MTAHNPKSLSRFASATYSDLTPASWFFYPTANAIATVIAAGYFNDSRSQLRAGDLITIASAQGGTVDTITVKLTAVPATGNVTVANASGLAAITDNSGGTASDTIAAISDSATKNAIATLAARINALAG
jgi:hypothetical protein